MGTNCVPLLDNLFLFCYEIDFMTSLSDDNQAYTIVPFNSMYRYLDDLLNIDISKEWSTKFIHLNCNILNRVNTSDTEAPLLDLHYLFLTVLFLQNL